MADIARLFDFHEGDLILDSQVDSELNQLVTAVNAKPDADTTLQGDLNADMLDGFHASASGGTGKIPVCNGTLQVGLNAEFLGGLSASDISDAGFPAGTKIPFYQAAPPAGWTAVSRPAIDRVFGWASSGATAGGTNNGSSSTTPPWNDIANHLSVFIGSHELSIDEIPAHSHVYTPLEWSATGGASGAAVASIIGTTTSITNLTGGGDGHAHDATVGGTSTWRPPISWFIIASKN